MHTLCILDSVVRHKSTQNNNEKPAQYLSSSCLLMGRLAVYNSFSASGASSIRVLAVIVFLSSSKQHHFTESYVINVESLRQVATAVKISFSQDKNSLLVGTSIRQTQHFCTTFPSVCTFFSSCLCVLKCCTLPLRRLPVHN